MYRYLVLLLISCGVNSHQFTPTYPELQPSIIPGILKAEMQIFNRREDIYYYELEVLDENNVPLPFSAQQKIVPVAFRERKNIEVYIREKDRVKAFYICSRSKILAGQVKASVVSSKICSKIRK